MCLSADSDRAEYFPAWRATLPDERKKNLSKERLANGSNLLFSFTSLRTKKHAEK
jgi:hypothetical protein